MRPNRLGALGVSQMQEIRSSNPPVVTGSCDLYNSQARHHRSLKLGQKLEYLNILIPSYLVHVVQQKQNVTKPNINWLFGYSRPRLAFKNRALKTIFHFTESFLKRKTVSPPSPFPLGKYLQLGLFKTPDTHFLSCLFPLPKFGTAGCPPAERRGVDTWVTVYQNFGRSF